VLLWLLLHHELAVNEVTGFEVQLVSGLRGEIVGQEWIEQRETWGENPAVGLGEQDGDAAREWGELVAV
jgi:hypothetical protein